MRMTKKLPLLMTIATLCIIIAVTGFNQKENKKPEPVVKNTEFEEIRGVWITYMDLDLQNTDCTYSSFKKRFDHITKTVKKKNFNTLVVQVRPFSDAMYNSAYFPYSHLLTGIQGKNPGYDPLKYMCSHAHKNNLKIHAWINPYRIRSSEKLKLAENHPYLNNKSLGVKVGSGIYYNPCKANVRRLIENGVKELVKNYDIDGIQFDDYFYPTKSKAFDSKEYNKYKNNVGAQNALSLENWRIANVNILIADCYSIIHSLKDNIVFGISPQGNIDNDYEMSADVKSWCSKSGYIDYICPQLYYSLENPALKFETALNNWRSLEYDKSVNLYIGLAGYKSGTDSDSGTWKFSDKILQDELKLLRKSNLKGFMLYSFENLESEPSAKEVSNLVKLLD